MGDDEERPRKRRFVEDEKKEHTLRALLNEEIDIEIGLRARLKETVESRLTWALILQNALEKHFEQPKLPENDGDTQNHFADEAIAAYKSTIDPCKLLIADDLPDPLPIARNPSLKSLTDPTKTQSRHTSQLHYEDRAAKVPNKYLFLRDSASTPTMIYKLACPDCDRSDFPRLQGLLNHCRLKHQREFGSHDECVQHCASVIPEDEQPWVIAHGVEITGMSASLRRLFEMAVGSYAGIVGMAQKEENRRHEEATHTRSKDEGEDADPGAEESTLVTKTLGHHKDTPGLAQVLGRAPKKKQINVAESDDPVDVLSVGEVVATHAWAMTYQERSRIGKLANEDDVSMESEEDSDSPEFATATQSPSHVHGSSRFHMTARLAISDWSLRIPDGEVKKYEMQAGATHKWMISVRAPSYSVHASTVLANMTVSSATEPPPAAFIAPLTVSEPPFCVMGLTEKPFLARITFEWAGTRNKATQIDHWIELDIGRSTRPVLGDEQVIDVELDRSTELLPRRSDSRVVDWQSDTDKKRTNQKAGTSEVPASASGPEHIKRLKRLLPRFPMTAKDVGLRKPPLVPYFLPASIQHLNSMVNGRRKAVEWGRARALWEAYKASEPTKIPETQAISESIKKISGPVDIYRWLEIEGYFPRASLHSRPSTRKNSDIAKNTFCAFCGQQVALHRKPKGARSKEADIAPMQVCALPEWAMRTPIVSLEDFLAHQALRDFVRPQAGIETMRRIDGQSSQSQLVRVVDPALTLAVQGVVSSLLLPCFTRLNNLLFIEEGEQELEPFALLGASVQGLVRRLISEGLQAMGAKLEAPKGSSTYGPSGSKRRLLTPAHIVRGLVEGSRRRGLSDVQRALLLSIARLGVKVPEEKQEAVVGAPATITTDDERDTCALAK